LDDFLRQMQAVRGLWPLFKAGKISGLPTPAPEALEAVEDELKYTEAIIRAMTREERHRPRVITGSRRRRIARGSGTTVLDVNRVLRDFDAASRMFD